ncbi:efflux RND transporter periplasmic adaptor subunit [Bordetella sp. LUAb4]|uniref:efflux RND transporter periplasmic adaptor subunit n=1 Tax=Bordetella sp. LUAb4 TaxID=2843195 RepID=UPI001E35CED4|nr:efflux RND transporter periplasmic adaptor subunit [Bordetella sp. LUAb4]
MSPPYKVKRFTGCAWSLTLLLAVTLAAGCGDKQEAVSAGLPPAVAVTVQTVSAQPADAEIDLSGRVEPIRTAEVRARVDGIVQKLLYTEGTDVEAGAALFAIDDSDYRAQLEQANAMLQRALAIQKNAQAVVTRFRPLVQRQAVSAQEYEAAISAQGQAQASVSDARAAVTLAKLRLERCTVRAPISGRVGRALVTEGALVSSASATLLAQINQLSPIFATFPKSNTAILDLMDEANKGGLQLKQDARFPVRLALANGRAYDEVGQVDFADLSIDPTSGAQSVRARFQNADRVLLPGQFVTGRFRIGVRKDTVMVPSRAVALNAENATVYVVGTDDVAHLRRVVLGDQQQGLWEIRSGLNNGERIIVDGWQKIAPEQRVRPMEEAQGKRPTP